MKKPKAPVSVFLSHSASISTATQFYNSAIRSFQTEEGWSSIDVIPSIVCAAFAVEVALKGLLRFTGVDVPDRVHQIKPLFEQLPIEYQGLLIASMFYEKPVVVSSHEQFIGLLESINGAFVEYRYFYEDPYAWEPINVTGLHQLAKTAINLLQTRAVLIPEPEGKMFLTESSEGIFELLGPRGENPKC